MKCKNVKEMINKYNGYTYVIDTFSSCMLVYLEKILNRQDNNVNWIDTFFLSMGEALHTSQDITFLIRRLRANNAIALWRCLLEDECSLIAFERGGVNAIKALEKSFRFTKLERGFEDVIADSQNLNKFSKIEVKK